MSLTLVREQCFIRIIYYCYYYYSATINALSVFPCIYLLGHRLLRGGCGIFNIYAMILVRAVHMKTRRKILTVLVPCFVVGNALQFREAAHKRVHY